MKHERKGVAFILAIIFLTVFATLGVSMLSMSSANAQMANNHHDSNSAFNAAISGLECAKYAVANTTTFKTGKNIVSDSEADIIWNNLYNRLQMGNLGDTNLNCITNFCDSFGSGKEITTGDIAFGATAATFKLRFYRYDSEPRIIKVQSSGTEGSLTRNIKIDMSMLKSNEVLSYAVASRGRMWLTGDSTIHGDVYSSWNRESISPFNMTSETCVQGTINTVLTKEQIGEQSYQLETLDEDGNPMSDDDGFRIYSDEDEIQGEHDGINYGQPDQSNIPGMDINDYDTDLYKNICFDSSGGGGNIPKSSSKEVEYFPHAAGDYNYPRDGSPGSTWNRKMERHVYENESFSNVRLPDNRNALFKNCTFNNVLYIDCNKNGSSKYNNVRFEDCTFNGTIVTDIPKTFKWRNNCLYFTGEATFNNTSEMKEATILAPHFNVNLGNTNPDQNENNVLTGAIVGGIVDIRGNAQIDGTIISMCDTTQWPSGYVTNIGATLNDGGSETAEAGDIGTITITPDQDNMLPSGIISPILIEPIASSYCEN